MTKKQMTPATRAKKVKEMADSISVRNHLFTMVNTGRVAKEHRARALQFLDYIDGEVLKTCFSIMPDNVAAPQNSTASDFVHAREKKQEDRKAMAERTKEAEKQTKKPRGVVKRVE
jgi:hypothetical protein